MKQGESKRLQPKDKHSKESWKRRDAGRKGKQEAYGVALAQFEEDHLGVVPDDQDAPQTTNDGGEGVGVDG